MVTMAKVGTMVIVVESRDHWSSGKQVGRASDRCTTSYGMQANLGKGRSHERSRTTSYGTKAILGIKVWSPGSGLFYVLSMAVAVAWSWETSVAMASLI